jgi:hypothetical protein
MALATSFAGGCESGNAKSDDDRAGKAKDKDKKDKKDKKDGVDKAAGKTFDGQGYSDLPEGQSYVVDLGFRPTKDGLKFPNGDQDASGKPLEYPTSSKGHLDSIGVQKLCGAKKACIAGAGDSCQLKPVATQFIDQVNKAMNGGQCEGFAVFGLSLFKQLDSPSAFGNFQTGYDLDRESARSPIGYYFAFQMINPVAGYKARKRAESTPAGELDFIIDHLSKKEDPVVVGFRKEGVGGHAVVAYAVEDRGNNVYWVRIWDNNFPGVSRAIEIDKAANTWKYDVAATNPGVPAQPWNGVASPNTIYASPLSLRMHDADCGFLGEDNGTRFVMATGQARPLIKDDSGNTIGFNGGKLVNDIPGAQLVEIDAFRFGGAAPEPVYILPKDRAYTIELQGGGSDNVSIGYYGASAALVVDNISIGAGQTDTFAIAADGFGFTYKPSGDRKPEVALSLDTADKDFLVDMSALEGGKPLTFTVDPESLALDVKEDGGAADYDFTITRFNAAGEKKIFKKADVPEGRGLTGSGGIALGDLE